MKQTVAALGMVAALALAGTASAQDEEALMAHLDCAGTYKVWGKVTPGDATEMERRVAATYDRFRTDARATDPGLASSTNDTLDAVATQFAMQKTEELMAQSDMDEVTFVLFVDVRACDAVYGFSAP